ncbi:T9SS type A sorting domain-containing protein [Aquimarina sp. AU58]|uniref:T9SS type A sorting domain-containing protein n=1 Tax=Aquimarina sp. AU58 TaxID=1874112 RepID=UPI001358760D|nr:T9SS type A sorting domain-containing protein [Aquimarina sp. AU58]
MKTGKEQGASQIANQRGIHTPDGALMFGDQTINLGYYMSILAMEYHMLASNNQSTENTLEQLYYTLHAINRLDENAESPYRDLQNGQSVNGYPTPQEDDLNGFFVRDDVPPSFVADNSEHFTQSIVPSQSSLLNEQVDSDWEVLIGADPGDPNDPHREANQMSQDQVYYIVLGIYMIQRFIPPQVDFNGEAFQDGEISIREESKKILRRIVRHISGKSWGAGEFYNWKIINPVTEAPVNLGQDVTLFCYALASISCEMSGNTTLCNEFHNVFSVAPLLGMGLWLGVPSTGIYISSNDNAHMYAILRAMMGGLGIADYAGCAARDFQHVPLVKQVLHGGTNLFNNNNYVDLLNAAPCEGPYMYNWAEGSSTHNSAHFEWSTPDRLIHPKRRGGTEHNHFPGEYPGLDYMMYHNLYYTVKNELYNAVNLIDNHITVTLPNGIFGTQTWPLKLNYFNTLVATNVINNNAKVTYHAGYEITLKPGFTAYNGADFHAKIAPFECSEEGEYRNNPSAEYIKGVNIDKFRPHDIVQPVEDYFYYFDERDDTDTPDRRSRNTIASNKYETVDGKNLPSIYPNPTTGKFTLYLQEIDGKNNYDITLLDIMGKVVNSKRNIKSNEINMDLSHRENGVYTIVIKTNDDVITKKIVKY